MRYAALLLLAISTWASSQTASAGKSAAFDGVEEAIARLSKITGLDPLKKVQTDTINRAGLKKFLEERIQEEVKPEEIRTEELALKWFGLVPDDFDLKQTTIDLLTEQAAAFYDYRRKKLFVLEEDAVKLPVAGDTVKEAQNMIVVHELAHALADQHFNLEKFIKRGRSDDSSLARTAVMEGQATWLMMEVLAQNSGQSLKKVPFMVEMMGSAARSSMLSQYPVLAKAPLYIQASLLFPYTSGLKFQHAVIEKSGTAGFAQVFRQPPATTQQILHPDKYFARIEPPKLRVPELAESRAWNTLTDGTVGEFDHAVLLEQYLSKKDADELAPKWRGGQMALLEHKRARNIVLLYVSEWEDPAAARRMFEAYRKVLQGKWKSFKAENETGTSVSGSGDHGLFRLTLDGNRVYSVEGVKSPGEIAAPGRK